MAPTIVCVVPEGHEGEGFLAGFNKAKSMLPMRVLTAASATDGVSVLTVGHPRNLDRAAPAAAADQQSTTHQPVQSPPPHCRKPWAPVASRQPSCTPATLLTVGEGRGQGAAGRARAAAAGRRARACQQPWPSPRQALPDHKHCSARADSRPQRLSDSDRGLSRAQQPIRSRPAPPPQQTPV
jgi:hypothetical protein